MAGRTRAALAHRGDAPAARISATGLDEVSRRVARNAADIIPDGSTLQFGVGKIPDAILASLSHLRDLGIHSGLINDAVVDLIECGAVTNMGKGLDAGITVTNQLIGTQRLYRFAIGTRLSRCARHPTRTVTPFCRG